MFSVLTHLKLQGQAQHGGSFWTAECTFLWWPHMIIVVKSKI